MQLRSEQIARIHSLVKEHGFVGSIHVEKPFEVERRALHEDIAIVSFEGMEWLIDHEGSVLSQRGDG